MAIDIFRAVFDCVSTGICIMDQTGQIILANPSLCETLGYRQEELQLRSYLDITHPDDQALARENLAQLLAGKTDRLISGNRLLCKNQQVIQVSTEVQPIKGSTAGSSPLFMAQIKDDSREKSLELQLQQVQKAESIAILAGGITHGFNNILSSILGNAEFALRYELEEDDPGVFSVQQIIKAAHRAGFLVKQILTLSRRQKPERSLINLGIIAKEVTRFLKITIPAKIDIRLVLKTRSDIVEADPGAMYQMLMNLCTQGIEVMQAEGGVLEIKLEDATPEQDEKIATAVSASPGYLKISVTNNGRGMSEEKNGRIAEKGTAPGLAVVNTLVKDLKGEVIVTREPGKGSCVSVTLPVHFVESRPGPDLKKPLSGGRENILFVDDDEQIVEFMERALDGLGYQVTGKTDSIEAYEIFSQSPEHFDLIISDMNMDGLTGDKLAQKILEIRSGIPIIICTGYDELLTKERAREIGISEIIMKPLMLDEIDEAVRRALGPE